MYPQKAPETFIYSPTKSPYLEVVYQDNDILLLAKPSGLLCVPGRKEEHADSLEIRAQETFPEARIVHRLDMCTSGLVIMAMNADAHRNLGLQFERRKTAKKYIARVWGSVKEDSGTINLPLICDWPNRPLQKIDHENGKIAQTNWEVLEREGDFTRLALYPITGRTHQLRVHMRALDHPILGDEFYAHEPALKAANRLQLHALNLEIHHPEDGRKCLFETPCPF